MAVRNRNFVRDAGSKRMVLAFVLAMLWRLCRRCRGLSLMGKYLATMPVCHASVLVRSYEDGIKFCKVVFGIKLVRIISVNLLFKTFFMYDIFIITTNNTAKVHC